MHLRVLGCAGGFPAADNPNSGYLLEDGETRIWLDAGTGTFAALQPHADYERLDALVLSHVHADHCADVYPLHVALQYEKNARMRLFGPPGTLASLGGLLDPEGEAKLAEVFDFQTVDEGAEIALGGVRLTFQRTAHPIHTLAIRAAGQSGTVVYSADTGPGIDLVPFARGADLFLCEATYQNARQGKPVHLTASQAGETAHRAGAGALLLTHLWPTFDAKVSLAEARATAGTIPVHLARPGGVFPVRSR
jgi:ribonuclease BN (tRNA processing enzyme)